MASRVRAGVDPQPRAAHPPPGGRALDNHVYSLCLRSGRSVGMCFAWVGAAGGSWGAALERQSRLSHAFRSAASDELPVDLGVRSPDVRILRSGSLVDLMGHRSTDRSPIADQSRAGPITTRRVRGRRATLLLGEGTCVGSTVRLVLGCVPANADSSGRARVAPGGLLAVGLRFAPVRSHR
jgi:hypothetical protein